MLNQNILVIRANRMRTAIVLVRVNPQGNWVGIRLRKFRNVMKIMVQIQTPLIVLLIHITITLLMTWLNSHGLRAKLHVILPCQEGI